MAEKPKINCKLELDLSYAFKKDVDAFVLEYEKTANAEFVSFAKLWRNKCFGFVFAKEKSAAELYEITEYYFRHVKNYFTSSYSDMIQVCALYLLYGLYYKQPFQGLVKIRLTLDEYRAIQTLTRKFQVINVLGPLYVFTKLQLDTAVIYTVLRNAIAPEIAPADSIMISDTEDLDLMGHSKDLYGVKESFRRLKQVDEEYRAALLTYTKTDEKGIEIRSGLNDLEVAYSQLLDVVDKFDDTKHH